MGESLESIHQRLAPHWRKIEGVFGVFLNVDGLSVWLRKRLANCHDEAKRKVMEIVDTEAPGTLVKFVVTEQEYPSGALAPDEKI